MTSNTLDGEDLFFHLDSIPYERDCIIECDMPYLHTYNRLLVQDEENQAMDPNPLDVKTSIYENWIRQNKQIFLAETGEINWSPLYLSDGLETNKNHIIRKRTIPRNDPLISRFSLPPNDLFDSSMTIDPTEMEDMSNSPCEIGINDAIIHTAAASLYVSSIDDKQKNVPNKIVEMKKHLTFHKVLKSNKVLNKVKRTSNHLPQNWHYETQNKLGLDKTQQENNSNSSSKILVEPVLKWENVKSLREKSITNQKVEFYIGKKIINSNGTGENGLRIAFASTSAEHKLSKFEQIDTRNTLNKLRYEGDGECSKTLLQNIDLTSPNYINPVYKREILETTVQQNYNEPSIKKVASKLRNGTSSKVRSRSKPQTVMKIPNEQTIPNKVNIHRRSQIGTKNPRTVKLPTHLAEYDVNIEINNYHSKRYYKRCLKIKKANLLAQNNKTEFIYFKNAANDASIYN